MSIGFRLYLRGDLLLYLLFVQLQDVEGVLRIRLVLFYRPFLFHLIYLMLSREAFFHFVLEGRVKVRVGEVLQKLPIYP